MTLYQELQIKSGRIKTIDPKYERQKRESTTYCGFIF